MTITTVNPATGEELTTYDEADAGAVTAAIELADARHRLWRRTSFADRAQVLRAAADLLDERADTLAALMADEMGKPIADGRREAQKCAWACRHYAEHAEGYLSDRAIDTEHAQSFVHHEPLGVVLAVMPWNFPLWQVIRFAAPALMAGNAALLKHASNVTGSALLLDALWRDAGAPDGLFRTLVIGSSRVDGVLEHPLVKAVTVTGSGPAGAAVASKAGSLLKKSVLELGGSDPYVVLADADVEAAAEICAHSRMTNGGQSCIAAKRFIVHDHVHDDFVELLAASMDAMTMGDPRDDDTDYGPQARIDLRDDLHDQCRRALAEGARLVLGGHVPDHPGAWYPATVLADVAAGSVTATEETFGPLAAVMRAGDEAECVRLANDTEFGLGAAVFSTDIERARHIAATQLDAGSCFVNAQVASDPRLPFGGVGKSGYGRELADLGIREFVNAKTVVVG